MKIPSKVFSISVLDSPAHTAEAKPQLAAQKLCLTESAAKTYPAERDLRTHRDPKLWHRGSPKIYSWASLSDVDSVLMSGNFKHSFQDLAILVIRGPFNESASHPQNTAAETFL